MQLKSLMFVVLAAVFVCASCEDPKNAAVHELREGARRPGDKLLHTQAIDVPSKWGRRVSVDVEFPQGAPLIGNITMITVLNRKKEGDITKIIGGAGGNRFSFKLTSKRRRGLHYDFTVFGYQA